jgi:carboxyl-terminal processing protease
MVEVPSFPLPPEAVTRPAHPAGRRGFGWPRTLITVGITLLISLPLGVYAGAFLEFHVSPAWSNELAPFFFSKPASGFDTDTLLQEWQFIERNYGRASPTQDAAFAAAAKGLAQSLDRFSNYLTKDELRRNQEFLSGQFGGIGASMSLQPPNNALTVAYVFPGRPADNAGLKSGDIVSAIDGVSTRNLTVEDAVGRVRGEVGTHVRLTVLRAGVTREFDLVRAKIDVPSEHSVELGKGVLFVRLDEFGENTAKDLDKDLRKYSDSKIILDLRGNPGGFLKVADDVTSEFVASGITVQVKSRNGQTEEHKVDGKGAATNRKIVVLVDGNTASASEIVALALRDHQRALLVGVKTFGKGSVQNDFHLRNGGDLHLTVALWYGPKGETIDNNGLDPDVNVKLDKPDDLFRVDAIRADPAKDNQLQAALRTLR